jgi:hypothetical protein
VDQKRTVSEGDFGLCVFRQSFFPAASIPLVPRRIKVELEKGDGKFG